MKLNLKIVLVVLSLLILAGIGSAGYVPNPVSSDVTGVLNKGATGAIITIPAAETSDDDQITTATPANNTTHILIRSSGVGSTTFLAQPDVPRNIIVTPSGSATGSLKITGTDIAGTAITSNLTFSGASVVAGLAAFKTITRIDGTFTQTTPRTLKIGTGDVLGLNKKFITNPVVYCALNNTREGTAPTVTVSATYLSLNTIDTSSAPGGSVTKIWVLY